MYALLLVIKNILPFYEKYLVLLNDQSKCVHIARAGIHIIQLRVALDDLCYFMEVGQMFLVCRFQLFLKIDVTNVTNRPKCCLVYFY